MILIIFTLPTDCGIWSGAGVGTGGGGVDWDCDVEEDWSIITGPVLSFLIVSETEGFFWTWIDSLDSTPSIIGFISFGVGDDVLFFLAFLGPNIYCSFKASSWSW